MDAVRAIADAVLYEGYLLWPYTRSAVKNQRRWTFGCVFPPAWSEGHADDRAHVSVECLVEGDNPAIDVRIRFLQVVRRQALDAGARPVDRIGSHLTWEEAVERDVGLGPFAIPAGEEREAVEGGALVRSWEALAGESKLEELAREAASRQRRVRLTISNATPFAGADRAHALGRSFCSAHAVLRVHGGAFVSPLDSAAEACRGDGLWPVLVGDPPDRSSLLASPIILEQYPRIAPESPGDLFDGGEIDELLILNVLALTDDERGEMAAGDPRAREILERCSSLAPEQLLRLHGAIRDFRPAASE